MENLKVLFVDDEPSILEQAKEFLEIEKPGIKVRTLTSAREALNLLKDIKFDAVVADYMMNGMNGIEFLDALREKEEKIPFIIFTGKGKEEVAMKALNLGADRYVKKGENPKSRYKLLANAICKEIEERRAKEREEFLQSLMRHDLRNKAYISQGYLELLENTELTEEQKSYVEKSSKACMESVELIEKVRTLREIGKERPWRIKIDPIIDRVVDDLGFQASQRGIDIDYQKCEYEVQGGPLLEKLFYSLVDNALKHSGGTKIKIDGRVQNSECIISVEDDGKGVYDDIKDRIFDRSWAGKDERGSGLGLYLCKKIAKSYSGEVEVEDSDLGGAKFNVYLNRVEKDENP